MLIDDVLELVHHTAVGNEADCILQMHLNIFVRILTEEQVHPVLGEEFHGHGVDLCRLHPHIRMLPDRIRAGQISLEGMSALMGDHVHIRAGAVKVCKDKGRIIVGHIGHISAGTLVLAPKHIKQTVLHHKIVKFPGLRGKLTVHLTPCLQDLLRRSLGRCISVRIEHGSVIQLQLIQTQTLSSLLVKLFREGHKVFLHLRTECLHLLLAVAVTPHAVIPQLHIVLIPHLLRLLRAVLHQLVIDLVQLIRIGPEKRTHSLPCSLSHLPIRAHQVRTQQGKIQLLALKRNLRPGDEHGILGAQCILLLHQRDQLLIHCLGCKLHIPEGNRSDEPHQLLPEGRIIQLLLVLQYQIVVKGELFIIVFLLSLIEFIRHICVKTNMRNGIQGYDPSVDPVKLLVQLKLLRTAFRLIEFPDQILYLSLNLIKIYSLVRHVPKLHMNIPSFLHLLCPLSPILHERVISVNMNKKVSCAVHFSMVK